MEKPWKRLCENVVRNSLEHLENVDRMFDVIEREGYKDQPCGETWTCRICTKEGILLSLSTEIFIGFGQCKECCRWKVGAVPAMIQCSWLALPKASHVLAQLVCVSTNILLNISPAKIQLQPKTHFLIFCAVLLLSFHCLLFPIPPPLVPPPPKKKKKKKKGGFVCVWVQFFTVANTKGLSCKPRRVWRLLFLTSLPPGFALFFP